MVRHQGYIGLGSDGCDASSDAGGDGGGSRPDRASRSIHLLPHEIQNILMAAKDYLKYDLFFNNPLPDIMEVLDLLSDAWAHGCKVTGTFHPCNPVSDTHVRIIHLNSDGKRLLTDGKMKNFHSGWRSMLVYYCKKLIGVKYGFDVMSREDIVKEVEYLLAEDRFLSPKDHREVFKTHTFLISS